MSIEHAVVKMVSVGEERKLEHENGLDEVEMWRSEVLQNDRPLLHIFIFVTFRKTVQEKHLNIGQNDSGYSG